MQRLYALVFVAAAACGSSHGGMSGPTMDNHVGAVDTAPPRSRVESKAILAREPVANHTRVKHILIAWKDLADSYDIDPRAKARTKADAENEVDSLLHQLESGADFDMLMKAASEDRASAESGEPMDVAPDAQLVIEFKQLGLRLNVGEIGVVESQFGFHIVKRVE